MRTKTEENNELIADFMGIVFHDDEDKWYDADGLYLDGLYFNESWDWLMPVVEKIESIEDEHRCAKYNVNTVQCFVEIVDNHTSEEIIELDGDTKKEATYKAVVEFIKWYNENK